MRGRGRVGNYFITSAYGKEHWRATAETQRVTGRRDGCRGDKDKDLYLQRKGNIAKEAYMAERVHIRSPGP